MWGGQADQHVGLEGRLVAEAGAWRGRRSWVPGRPGTDVREGHSVWSEEVGPCLQVQSQDGWRSGSPGLFKPCTPFKSRNIAPCDFQNTRTGENCHCPFSQVWKLRHRAVRPCLGVSPAWTRHMVGRVPPGPASHLVVGGIGVSLCVGAGSSGSKRSVQYRSKIQLSARIPQNTFFWSSFTWGRASWDPVLHPGTLPALSTATGLAPSPWPKATGHLSRHLPRTHPAPGSPGPQLAHLVLEALSLKVLQELKVDIPALSLGVTVDH